MRISPPRGTSEARPTSTTRAGRRRQRTRSTHLRVGLIAGARFPVAEPFAGGLESHTWLLASALRDGGTPVVVFAPEGSDDRLVTVPMPRAPKLSAAARADIATMPEWVVADHHAYLGVMLGLRDAATRFDVVHNNSVHHLPVAMASALPVPMVTTLHTPPTPWLESALQLRGGATAGAFAAVSHHTAHAWSHLVSDVEVIPNGIDLTTWRAGAGDGDVVWSGRIVPEKAPHLAIDAARRAGMPITLAGPIHDRDYWQREVAPRLGASVRWAGHLDQRTLCELVGSASVCAVTPVWDEPFGLVVLESLACGTPVAAFARGGVPEVVDHATGCLATADDVSALADALRRAQHLSRQACRARAEKTGCVQLMAQRYRRLYARVTA